MNGFVHGLWTLCCTVNTCVHALHTLQLVEYFVHYHALLSPMELPTCILLNSIESNRIVQTRPCSCAIIVVRMACYNLQARPMSPADRLEEWGSSVILLPFRWLGRRTKKKQHCQTLAGPVPQPPANAGTKRIRCPKGLLAPFTRCRS